MGQEIVYCFVIDVLEAENVLTRFLSKFQIVKL